jgi:outer membrane protein TolC
MQTKFRSMLVLLCLSWPLAAQNNLSLPQAVQLALRKNKALEASKSIAQGSEAHTRGARSGYYPTLNYNESATRSNNPVFVFSSLLTQHKFGSENFQIEPLNRPNALDNFRSSLLAQQTLFDGGQTKHTIQASRILEQAAFADVQRTETEVTYAAVRAYWDAVLSEAEWKAAEEAVKSAEADLQRAENIHQAGMSTDADVLSIRVHLARVKEQQIRRTADLAIARAALNDALGQPLDKQCDLTTPLTRSAAQPDALQALEKQARDKRPEQLRMKYASDLASAQLARERSSLFPVISVQAALEADRQTFVTRGGANWTVAASLNWNLFNGFRDKEQIEEAHQNLLSAKAAQERMSSAVNLEVIRAWEEMLAANERIAVSEATVAQAQESLRITQNRYQAGLSTVTDLLRTEAALLDSRTEYLSALHDQRIAAVQLDVAAGLLTADSASLKD